MAGGKGQERAAGLMKQGGRRERVPWQASRSLSHVSLAIEVA